MDEALAHPYFEDLHDPTDEPVCDRPFLLNVDDQNLSKEDLQVGHGERLECRFCSSESPESTTTLSCCLFVEKTRKQPSVLK